MINEFHIERKSTTFKRFSVNDVLPPYRVKQSLYRMFIHFTHLIPLILFTNY